MRLWALTAALACAACTDDTPPEQEAPAVAPEIWRSLPTPGARANVFDAWRHPDGRLFLVGDGLAGTMADDHWAPDALPNTELRLRAVHGRSGTVVAVGLAGAIISRSSIGAWATEGVGLTEENLADVWVAEDDTVWVAGDAGTVLRRAAGTWEKLETNSVDRLLGVWAAGDEAWAVGAFGTALRLTEEGWRRTSTDTGRLLAAVWGTGSTMVLAVGLEGTFLRWNGEAWAEIENDFRPYLRSLWGTSETDVWAVGWGGAVLHYDGEMVCQVPMADWRLEAVTGSLDEVLVAGASGAIWAFAGETPCPVPELEDGDAGVGGDAGVVMDAGP